MRTKLLLATMNTLGALAGAAGAQISVGSDGSDGAFAFVGDAGDPNVMTIDLGLAATSPWTTPSPVAGRGVYDSDAWAVVFKYTNVTVPTGKTVRFTNHPTRAPVVWLSQGDVIIDGEIDLDGADGHAWNATPTWAEPGPGGFRGGLGRPAGAQQKQTAGFGPGGGFTGSSGTGSPAGFAAAGDTNNPFMPGPAYGTRKLEQLLGGSGGGDDIGANRPGSGAGGGAMLIAADTALRVSGSIHADGGTHGAYANGVTVGGGPGSGGALRLLAHEVEIVPGALVRCLGRSIGYGGAYSTSSAGRIRIEANVHTFGTITNPVPSVGLPGPVFSPGQGRVRVASVDGVAVPIDPKAALLDFFADVGLVGAGTKNVTIVGVGIPDQTTVELRVTDSLGEASVVTGTLTATGQPGETAATLQVDFPPSVVVLQARALLP